MASHNTVNINEWIKDLLDPTIGIRFNADYTCVTAEDGVLMGDGSLFLAYRHADIAEDTELHAWFAAIPPKSEDYTASEVVVNRFTGIPLVDARALMWPQELLDADFDISAITAGQFVRVLQGYLRDGVVSWKSVIDG